MPTGLSLHVAGAGKVPAWPMAKRISTEIAVGSQKKKMGYRYKKKEVGGGPGLLAPWQAHLLLKVSKMDVHAAIRQQPGLALRGRPALCASGEEYLGFRAVDPAL